MNRSLAICIFVAIQWTIAITAAQFDLGEAIARFTYLDAQWYNHIAGKGYVEAPWSPDGSQFAFFPAWPFAIRYLSQASGLSFHVVGTLFSFLLFLLSISILGRGLIQGPGGTAMSKAAWVAFIFSPGSWVFLSNHTESLFLLLSVVALWRASKDDWLGAGLFAGFSALTRNQGLMLIAAIAVGYWFSKRAGPRKLSWIMAFGLIATTLGSLWPIYEWSITGDPFMHIKAQRFWHVSPSIAHYIRNLLWLSFNNLPRILIFWAGLLVAIYLLIRRSDFRALGFYVLFSLLLLPLQGNNFPQAYRFSAVLFPIWFLIGDTGARIARSIPSQTAARYAGYIGLGAFMLWHIRIAAFYFYQSNWPY